MVGIIIFYNENDRDEHYKHTSKFEGKKIREIEKGKFPFFFFFKLTN